MSEITSSQLQISMISSFLGRCFDGTWVTGDFPLEPDQAAHAEQVFAEVRDHFVGAEPWLEVQLTETRHIRIGGQKQ